MVWVHMYAGRMHNAVAMLVCWIGGNWLVGTLLPVRISILAGQRVRNGIRHAGRLSFVF